MIRTLTALSVLAIASAASVPASAENIRVNLAGKTPAAAYGAISVAARNVCRSGIGDRLYALRVESACVAETIAATLAKVSDPALLQYGQARKSLPVASS